MKANRLAQLIIAAGIALAASAPSFSNPTAPTDGKPEKHHRHEGKHHGKSHRHAMPMHGMMLRGIELSEEQKVKIGELRKEAMPQQRDAMKEAFEARKELQSLVQSGKFDDAHAKRLAQTSADAMARVTFLRAKTESAILAQLTPEQRKQLAEARAKRMKEHQERWKNRPAHPGEPPAPSAPDAPSAG